jgi:hypothetical protein
MLPVNFQGEHIVTIVSRLYLSKLLLRSSELDHIPWNRDYMAKVILKDKDQIEHTSCIRKKFLISAVFK